jgi:hypothetical protein
MDPPADPPDNIFVAAGGVYHLFCEELQTLWFAAVLHQIFFPNNILVKITNDNSKKIANVSRARHFSVCAM